MSIEIMSRVWKSPLGNSTTKLVMLALADNSNDQCVCWPSIKTIAKKCDLSERAVSNILSRLKKEGLLEIKSGGGTVPNRYRICVEKLPFEQRSPLNDVQGTPERRAGVPLNDVQGTPERRAKEPSLNHQKTTIKEPSAAMVDFEVFWKAYPRKIAKTKAEQSFKKHAAGVSVEILVAAVIRQSRTRQWMKDDGEFIPHPATWLNQHRWEDGVECLQINDGVAKVVNYQQDEIRQQIQTLYLTLPEVAADKNKSLAMQQQIRDLEGQLV